MADLTKFAEELRCLEEMTPDRKSNDSGMGKILFDQRDYSNTRDVISS